MLHMMFSHWLPLSARLAAPLIVGVLLLLAGAATGQGVGDSDGDGLSDVIEVGLGTDPLNPDTDGDGLPDGLEVLDYGSNPHASDSDADTVGDACDNCAADPNPLQEDLDLDGIGTYLRTAPQLKAAEPGRVLQLPLPFVFPLLEFFFALQLELCLFELLFYPLSSYV